MRRLLLVLVTVTLLTSACGGPASRTRRSRLVPVASPTPASSVTIEIVGTPGLKFTGSYGELGATQSVSGTVPARVSFKMAIGFTVALQKRVAEGELGMTVTVDGRVVNQSKTVKAYGVLAYTHRVSR